MQLIQNRCAPNGTWPVCSWMRMLKFFHERWEVFVWNADEGVLGSILWIWEYQGDCLNSLLYQSFWHA